MEEELSVVVSEVLAVRLAVEVVVVAPVCDSDRRLPSPLRLRPVLVRLLSLVPLVMVVVRWCTLRQQFLSPSSTAHQVYRRVLRRS